MKNLKLILKSRKKNKLNTLKASQHTNGMGGGAIMEGKYTIYKKDPLG
ncbi:hypothetical protein ACTXMF_12575 [Psychrobacter celer]